MTTDGNEKDREITLDLNHLWILRDGPTRQDKSELLLSEDQTDIEVVSEESSRVQEGNAPQWSLSHSSIRSWKVSNGGAQS